MTYRYFLAAISCFTVASQNALCSEQRPNILLIVADDLGYSDLGCYGSEISTPNLDSLAEQGVMMTQFYACPTCSVTRATLLTGVDHHRTGLGTMSELLNDAQKGKPGYEGFLNQRVVTIAETLRGVGYRTAISGKWHLGEQQEHRPDRRGFDKSFVLLEAMASHWDERPVLGSYRTTHCENGQVTKLPNDFYSTTTYTDKLVQFLRNAKREDDKPFFAMLSFTAPHCPLHAPEEHIASNMDKYDVGYEEIRERRIQRMKKLGLVSDEANPFPRLFFVRPWERRNEDSRSWESKKMAVYASMIEALDDNVGRLLNFLRESGEYDSTMIVFLSDNGADGVPISMYPGNTREWVDQTYPNNTLENMGSPDSLVALEFGWAQAAVGVSSWFKGLPTEGGLLVPCLIKMPGKENASRKSTTFATIKDLVPTFLEMAAAEHPSTFRGRDVLPIEGTSMVPLLAAKTARVHPSEYVMAWEFNGNKALRQGPWKALWFKTPLTEGKWQLFNIEKDPGETNDLSQTYPRKLESLIQKWNEYAKRVGVLDFDGSPAKG